MVITGLFIGAGCVFRPSDPLLLECGFPYLILPPLMAALRYGFGYGIASALPIAGAAWVWVARTDALPANTVHLALGSLTTLLLAGQFADVWRRRWDASSSAIHYSQKRLDEFSPRYYALQASHDRLEQKLAGTTQSLRTGVETIRKSLVLEFDEANIAATGRRILDLFSTFCSVQVATVLEVKNGEEILWPAAAHLGTGVAIAPDDPMVDTAFRSRKMLSVQDGTLDRADLRDQRADILAVVPIMDSYDSLWALLVVQEMPFIAFHQDNLTLMTILGGYIGDQLTGAIEQVKAVDASEADFRLQLRHSLRDLVRHQLPVSLVRVDVDGTLADPRVIDMVSRSHRGLDVLYSTKNRTGDRVLAVLLPLTEAMGTEAYCARIEAMIRQRVGKSLGEAGVRFEALQLSGADTVDDIVESLRRSKVEHVESPPLAAPVPA